jgi:hypothetical protein
MNFASRFKGWHQTAAAKKKQEQAELASARANWARMQRENRQASLAKRQREKAEAASMRANWLRLERQEAERKRINAVRRSMPSVPSRKLSGARRP